MSELIFGDGFGLNWDGEPDEALLTTPSEYLVSIPEDSDQAVLRWTLGTAKVYGLNPVAILGIGSMAFGGGSARIYSLQPYGGFDDFTIFPSTGADPVSGLLIANNTSALSGGVGNAWTRLYNVFIPPRKTRFVVPHIKLGALAANTSQYLDAHQLEVLSVGSNSPGSFVSARSIQPYVRPTRLNYATGSTTVTKLTPGIPYTASALVSGARVSYQFVPTTSTWTLTFGGTPTQILVEEGTVAGDYFDGDSGDDYLWEQINGVEQVGSRAYYYPDRNVRHDVLVRTLEANVALGVEVLQPIYATFPFPSSIS